MVNIVYLIQIFVRECCNKSLQNKYTIEVYVNTKNAVIRLFQMLFLKIAFLLRKFEVLYRLKSYLTHLIISYPFLTDQNLYRIFHIILK